jgi:hypothetical protein
MQIEDDDFPYTSVVSLLRGEDIVPEATAAE